MTAATDPIARSNAAQRRASRPEASVWVAASAGTGKTKVLTDRVLRLLLAGTAPARILCLTFTKAAAAEMAVRINRRLAEWAVVDEAELVDALTDLSGAAPNADALATARRLFARVVDAPGGLQIDTLHAFCQSVLQRFPVEAGIAPHFEVLDERTAWEVLHEAKAHVLVRAATEEDGDLAAALAVLTGIVEETRFDELIDSLKGERGRLRDLIDRHGGTEALIGRLYDRLGVPPTETEDDVVRAACRDDAIVGAGLQAAASALLGSGPRDQARGAVLAAWLADRDARPVAWDAYLGVFFTATTGELRKSLLGKAAAEAAPGAEAALAAEAERLAAVKAACRSRRVAAATAALVRVGGAVLEIYATLKAARAAMDYDDLILRTRDLLRRAGDVSWVMYKLDEGIDHILIDEAQDTNPEQWQIVRALAGDFFASLGRDDVAARTVFAVGDAKQSIFSFQRADPAGFEDSRTHFERLVGAAGGAWDEVDLDVSFRSVAAVLEAVDAVFARDAARDGVAEPGRPVHHQPSRTGQSGRVELWPAPTKPDVPAIEPWALPVESDHERDPEQQVAALIGDRIKGWLKGREALAARARAVRPGDIMILVRRRGSFMARMVRELKIRDLPVAGVDRMVVGEQLAVMDLAALGDFLLLPSDDLVLATVLKGPLIGLTEDQLYDLAHGRGETTLWAALTARQGEHPAYAEAYRRLSGLLARADFMPPYEFYAELLGAGGGRAQLLARLGPEAADPIEEFLTLALAFERSHPPSLQGFLAWFGSGATEVKRELEQGTNAVRVMTVHGAKGLQAPIVILPDTMQPPGARGIGLFWDDDILLWPPRKADDEAIAGRLRAAADARRLEEYRRLLYVAMTRAEDRLYVCGWPSRATASAGNWYDLIRDALAPKAAPAAFDGPWEGDALRLDCPQTEAAEREEADEAAIPEKPLPDWVRRDPPPEATPPRPLAPSRPEAGEPAVISPLVGDGRGFRRGLLIHRLLELLPDLPLGDRAAACRQWLDRQASDLDAGARSAIAAETLAVLEDTRFSAVFAPGSRAEVALTGQVGGRVVSGQVDRLAVTDGAVLVVDYKTNRSPPPTIAEVPVIYLRQMAAYRALLAGIYSNKTITCGLLWTDGPGLMELSDGLLDRHAP